MASEFVKGCLFKSPEGEAKFKAAYDATLALWPTTYESFDVPTRFGATHLHASGPKDAPALVLLPAAAVSSTMWFPNVADLSQHYRTYAVDTLGDAGRSQPVRVPRTNVEYGEWLIDVFNELKIQKARLAGLSYGGFLTLNFALHAAERVERIVMLAPAGSFVPLNWKFYAFMFAVGFFPFRAALGRALGRLSARGRVNETFADQMFMAVKHCRPQLKVWPRVFSDEELRELKVPALLLVGGQEILYDAAAAVLRAKRLIPRIEAEIIPRAGHLLTMDQPEVVNTRMLKFLSG